MQYVVIIFALVAAVNCAERTLDNSCPKSLLITESRLFLKVEGDLCYRFVTYAETTYADAEKTCEEDGGHLAMPKSKKLNNFLVKTLKDGFNSQNPTWIGLNDIKDEGKFMWEDDSALDWDNFESDNGPGNSDYLLQGPAEDCVAIHKDGKWHDYQCGDGLVGGAFAWITWSDTSKPFVCQYPALELPKEEEADVDDGTNDDEEPSHNDQVVVDGHEDDNGNATAVQMSEGKNQTGSHDIDEDEKNENIPEDDNDETIREDDEDENSDARPTKPDSDRKIDDGAVYCGSFYCDRDCGMNGFKIDENGCQTCECNVEF